MNNRNREYLTKEQIDQFNLEIATLVKDGYSIGLARKKVLGTFHITTRAMQVMSSPVYLKTLNGYMKKIGMNYRYEYKDGSLVPSKQPNLIIE